MNLLIVNDVEPICAFLKDQIPWENYGISQACCAYNADEAKEILQREAIDILLCDIEMPGDDGLALIRWVKEKGLACDTIFLTAHANFEYIHEALHLDCMDYILFPSAAENIGEAVKKVVDKRLEKQRNDSLIEYGEQWVSSHAAEPKEEDRTLSSQDIVSNTVRYILDNISDPDLSINAIAEKNYLSSAYVSRLFKQEKGITINQFIIKQRMQLAAQLLENGDTPPGDICDICGYNNYPYFITTFRKYWGCTPGQYRQNLRKESSSDS